VPVDPRHCPDCGCLLQHHYDDGCARCSCTTSHTEAEYRLMLREDPEAPETAGIFAELPETPTMVSGTFQGGAMSPQQAEKSAVLALCAYEAAAILTGKAPTISALCRRRREVEAVLLALLILHLHGRTPAPAGMSLALLAISLPLLTITAFDGHFAC